VASVVLGLAIQDTLGNLFAGIAMQFDKPYEIGDWIEVSGPGGKWQGQVYEVTWRATALTGIGDELISIPNRVIGQGQVVNYSQRGQPFSRVQTLRIAHGSDTAEARAVVQAALAATPGVSAAPAPVVLLSEVTDAGLTLRLIYWIDDLGQQYVVADRVLDAALAALDHRDIALAVPRLALLQSEPAQRAAGVIAAG
jgi:small-conductance mechanosensitive channel